SRRITNRNTSGHEQRTMAKNEEDGPTPPQYSIFRGAQEPVFALSAVGEWKLRPIEIVNRFFDGSVSGATSVCDALIRPNPLLKQGIALRRHATFLGKSQCCSCSLGISGPLCKSSNSFLSTLHIITMRPSKQQRQHRYFAGKKKKGNSIPYTGFSALEGSTQTHTTTTEQKTLFCNTERRTHQSVTGCIGDTVTVPVQYAQHLHTIPPEGSCQETPQGDLEEEKRFMTGWGNRHLRYSATRYTPTLYRTADESNVKSESEYGEEGGTEREKGAQEDVFRPRSISINSSPLLAVSSDDIQLLLPASDHISNHNNNLLLWRYWLPPTSYQPILVTAILTEQKSYSIHTPIRGELSTPMQPPGSGHVWVADHSLFGTRESKLRRKPKRSPLDAFLTPDAPHRDAVNHPPPGGHNDDGDGDRS
ncbi:16132_t:CDS:2, partial [Acaulospora colombiana]